MDVQARYRLGVDLLLHQSRRTKVVGLGQAGVHRPANEPGRGLHPELMHRVNAVGLHGVTETKSREAIRPSGWPSADQLDHSRSRGLSGLRRFMRVVIRWASRPARAGEKNAFPQARPAAPARSRRGLHPSRCSHRRRGHGVEQTASWRGPTTRSPGSGARLVDRPGGSDAVEVRHGDVGDHQVGVGGQHHGNEGPAVGASPTTSTNSVVR